jgi:hypothetical protein
MVCVIFWSLAIGHPMIYCDIIKEMSSLYFGLDVSTYIFDEAGFQEFEVVYNTHFHFRSCPVFQEERFHVPSDKTQATNRQKTVSPKYNDEITFLIQHVLAYMYEVCPDDFRKISIKRKQLYLQHFVFLAFVNMAASNLHALQAALLLPPERLGKVHRRAISRTPISVLMGRLLSENEGGQLSLRPRPPLKQ